VPGRILPDAPFASRCAAGNAVAARGRGRLWAHSLRGEPWVSSLRRRVPAAMWRPAAGRAQRTACGRGAAIRRSSGTLAARAHATGVFAGLVPAAGSGRAARPDAPPVRAAGRGSSAAAAPQFGRFIAGAGRPTPAARPADLGRKPPETAGSPDRLGVCSVAPSQA